MGELLTIEPRLDRDAAESRVSRFARGFSVRGETRVFYPYDWTHWRLTASLWGWRRTLAAHCLVDARTGQAATCDRFETVAASTEDAVCLSAGVSDRALLDAARTYARHAHRHHRRSLVAPELELVERRRVYRLLWVVACRGADGAAFRTLVDAVTGAFQVMDIDIDRQKAACVTP